MRNTPGFAGLHNHTHYSLLDSLNKPGELFQQAANLGIHSLAITEHGNMHSVVECAKAAEKTGVGYIPGIEAYFAEDRKNKGKNYHLTLVALDSTGYKNLCKLSSLAYTEGFYRKPRVDLELLEAHNEGVVCLSGCLSGIISRRIQHDEDPLEWVRAFREIFGERFFIEIWDHQIEIQRRVVRDLLKISNDLSVPVVATGDCHYTMAEDYDSHAMLIGVGQKKSPEEAAYPTRQFHLKSPEEMARLFQAHPEAISNTVEIAKMCDFKLDLETKHFPKYQMSVSESDKEEDNVKLFRSLVLKGIKEKYPDLTQEVKDRMKYEVKVIERLGFVDYFLILWDLIKFTEQEGIPSGPGRGSAAGSVVSYALGITEIDPIKYGLLFERFLNPDRVSDPDVDLDFCIERREEVVEYLQNRYGEENVAKITTFAMLRPKGTIKAVGRAIGLPFSTTDQIASYVDERDPDWDLTKLTHYKIPAAQTIPNFNDFIMKCKALQGTLSHRSTHAAGVVIGDRPLIDLLPVCTESRSKNSIACQFTMEDVEAIGLLKIDILGLETLTIIQEALNSIQLDPLPDSYHSLDDPSVFKTISSANTVGVFQMESSGMRQFLTQLSPQNFHEIALALALYRPGTMDSGMHTAYIRRKNGEEEPEYPHPAVEEVTRDTYGVLIFQEQIMKLCTELCGYSIAQADTLRKIIGKKIMDLMPKEKEGFIRSAQSHSKVSKEVAEDIWGQIETFARYGFNMCVTGDTLVTVSHPGFPTPAITVSDLWELQLSQTVRGGKLRSGQVNILQMNEDYCIEPGRLRRVHRNGIAKVFHIKTVNGHEIKVTARHRLLTDSGYLPAKDIKEGDLLVVMGEPEALWTPTTTSIIESITPLGKEEVFDVEMYTIGHNYVANGIVSHNSHAVSYGVISYRTAWLKTHYPKEFMAAALTHKIGTKEKIRRHIYDCVQRQKIMVLPPDINRSEGHFKVEGEYIRAALALVERISTSLSQDIVQEREENGKYTSLLNLMRRVKMPSPAVEALVTCGALDKIIPNRRSAIDSIENLAKSLRKPGSGLFEDIEVVEEKQEYSPKESLERAREATGLITIATKDNP